MSSENCSENSNQNFRRSNVYRNERKNMLRRERYANSRMISQQQQGLTLRDERTFANVFDRRHHFRGPFSHSHEPMLGSKRKYSSISEINSGESTFELEDVIIDAEYLDNVYTCPSTSSQQPAEEYDHLVEIPLQWNQSTIPAETEDISCDQVGENESDGFASHQTTNSQHFPIAVGGNLMHVPKQAMVLPTVTACSYCNAQRFYREPKTFCCLEGKIHLASNTPLQEQEYLFTSDSDESKLFRTFIRAYNSSFAFTSFGALYDKELSKRNHGIYSFRIQGQVYHYINQLLPADEKPSQLQLYFYDTEHEIVNRLSEYPNLNPNLLALISKMLNQNPYSIFFRNLSSLPNLKDQTIVIHSNPNQDQRVYNAPVVSQVAAIWMESDDNETTSNPDILVHGHQKDQHRIKYYYGCYDPLQYPILFPFGETGWHNGIKRLIRHIGEETSPGQNIVNPHNITTIDQLLNNECEVERQGHRSTRTNVSIREYYCYKLQIRHNDKSLLLRAGRLLQQYIIDMYIKMETARLDYFRNNQKQIRADLYAGILDGIAQGETRGSAVGKRVVLPASFIGGPRDMKRRYTDAMALVQKFGKPDLFITMTCNPSWPEIKNNLAKGEEAQNRPDLVARVFRAKLEELKDDLFKKQIFGPVAAYVYVTEFQKRGLPHVHFLIILKQSAKIISPNSYDNYVSAEIPPENQPYLRACVRKHMMHGPCGNLKPTNICMKKGQCKNYYPKDFCDKTTQGKDSYPIYKRRDNKDALTVRGCTLDNRWVIPYNPYLLAKYDCHINVEICSTIKAVKYLYKYIFKGHDKISFKIVSETTEQYIDEIDAFQSGRWIGAPEAMWRIYAFTLNEMHPSVINLQLHLEGKHIVSYKDNQDLNQLVQNQFLSKTMLTEFFAMNKNDLESRQFLYKEYPEHYVWSKKDRQWTRRKKGLVIGRIVSVNPSEGERYYLRLLLNHIKGPSYKDILTVNGVIASSFREAALFRELLHTDDTIEACLHEASSFQMPFTLRRLFATILVYCNPVDPKLLWEKFEHSMSEDFSKLPNISPTQIKVNVLNSIHLTLESMNRSIDEFHLIDHPINCSANDLTPREIIDELQIPVTDEDKNLITTLNYEQKNAYDLILSAIENMEQKSFFIDGPGGTGKTYLYRALLATIRSKNHIALATATSGVAPSILPGGRTAHSRFKIPIDIDDQATCSISKQTGLAKLLKAAKLIIWDEASMVKRQAIETFDRMLQDIMDCHHIFGGKIIVFGGDFRQVLPVVPKSTKEESINCSFVNSYLWPLMKVLKLTQNMRARIDPNFTDFLLRVGNGTEPTIKNTDIIIPPHLLLPVNQTEEESINQLICFIFPPTLLREKNVHQIINRAILTPKNDTVDDINQILIEQFPGDAKTYFSRDESINSENYMLEEDFLNTLTPNGYPPYKLVLKIGCPIMLLRNIDPSKGLSNGTRLICRNFEKNVIDAEIALGHYKGNRVFIPRIPVLPNKTESYPFPFKRVQYPIRISFAMTINKAQGQTLEKVGIYLPEPVFSHGQLYVALSRATSANNLKIVIRSENIGKNATQAHTANIVYKEILMLAHES